MFQGIALYNSNATIIMVAVFGIVCLVLIGILINFMSTKTKNESDSEED
jgi:hypothetical protein|nr:hypothetical protein [uncultured Psychroserpens sp.]